MKLLNRNISQQHDRHSAGFTLTEMLVTILILVLASTLLATGIPVAIDTYRKTVRTANAQVALSTTITVLKSELGTAQDITNVGDRVRYKTSDGYYATIGNSSDLEEIWGLDKQYFNGSNEMMYDYGLITNSAITDELRVKCDRIYLEEDPTDSDKKTNQVVVKGLVVYDANDVSPTTPPLAGVDEYRILTRCN